MAQEEKAQEKNGTGKKSQGKNGTGKNGTGKKAQGKNGTGKKGTGKNGTGKNGTKCMIGKNGTSWAQRLYAPQSSRGPNLSVNRYLWVTEIYHVTITQPASQLWNLISY